MITLKRNQQSGFDRRDRCARSAQLDLSQSNFESSNGRDAPASRRPISRIMINIFRSSLCICACPPANVGIHLRYSRNTTMCARRTLARLLRDVGADLCSLRELGKVRKERRKGREKRGKAIERPIALSPMRIGSRIFRRRNAGDSIVS